MLLLERDVGGREGADGCIPQTLPAQLQQKRKGERDVKMDGSRMAKGSS